MSHLPHDYCEGFDPGNNSHEFFYETDWGDDLAAILDIVDHHFEEFHPDYDRHNVEFHVERFQTHYDLHNIKVFCDDEQEFLVFVYKERKSS